MIPNELDEPKGALDLQGHFENAEYMIWFPRGYGKKPKRCDSCGTVKNASRNQLGKIGGDSPRWDWPQDDGNEYLIHSSATKDSYAYFTPDVGTTEKWWVMIEKHGSPRVGDEGQRIVVQTHEGETALDKRVSAGDRITCAAEGSGITLYGVPRGD